MRRLVILIRALILFCKIGPSGLIKLEEELRLREKQAYTDSLTGLRNLRFLQEFGKREIELAKRHKRILSLVYLDLNDLKKINDGPGGHYAGDLVICEFVRILRKHCRSTDMLCRIGGDEFVALLPETSQYGAEQLMKRIEKDLAIAGIRFSYGIVVLDDDNKHTLEELLKKADQKMYAHKKSGSH